MSSRSDFYKHIAELYDLVIGERDEVPYLKKLVAKSHPSAKSMLELACGTGTLLQHFSRRLQVSGVDISSPMLKLAKQRIAKGVFYEQDMCQFELNSKFDIIVCLFNSLNHLANFKEWKTTFAQVKKHLNPDGIFIFDINTELGIRSYFNEPDRVEKSGPHYLTTKFSALKKDTLLMHVRTFTQEKGNLFKLNESRIKERSYPTKDITKELKKLFKNVEILDPEKPKPNSKSEVLYFVCKN